ncbi:MAG: ion transporter [Mariniblastus sp.]
MSEPQKSPAPINPRNAPRTLKEKIHEIIFGAHTFSGLSFDIMLMLAIVASVTVISLETVTGIQTRMDSTLFFLKWFFTILFTIEYGLRIYCVRNPSKYIFSFWGIIDLLAILPDYILLMTIPVNSSFGVKGFSVVRSLRLLRVFRILNLSWIQNEGEDLGNAIWRARGKVIVFLMVVLIIVTVAGTLMYEIEHYYPLDEEGNSISKFTSIPIGIYWAIVTMTTVGFGDIVPMTAAGQVVSAVLILVGYSLIIVPTGFVSAEIIDSKRKPVTTVSCASCVTEGHANDARYCKYCGEEL